MKQSITPQKKLFGDDNTFSITNSRRSGVRDDDYLRERDTHTRNQLLMSSEYQEDDGLR